jgi:DNA-binding winged helix-turn-helix (wHTH) protein
MTTAPLERRPSAGGKVRFGTCVLDLDARQLHVDGHEVHITHKAFSLLLVLTESAPRALTKAELLERLWPKTYVSEDALARLIGDVRLAIGDNAHEQKWIRTVHGFGYAFTTAPDGGTRERPPTVCSLTWGSHEFRLTEGEHVVGRDADVAVPLNSAIVSRRHARITVTEGIARIEDLGSKNGTLVGGTPVEGRRTLLNADVIQVGDFELKFHIATSLATVTRQR